MNKHATVVDETLAKFDYKQIWKDLLVLEEKGSWETPEWATALKKALHQTDPIMSGSFLLVAYRHVALRAMHAGEVAEALFTQGEVSMGYPVVQTAVVHLKDFLELGARLGLPPKAGI